MNFAALTALTQLLTRRAALVIVLFAVWAYFQPGAFMWVNPHISPLLGVVMFGMGLTVKAADFRVVFTHPKEIALGALAQYTIMPLLAWLLAVALRLPPDLALGVILVGCCPGGTASNVITYIARGDVPLSVGMTIISTLAAPICTPLLVYVLAHAWVKVSVLAMFLSVVKVVLVPVLAGIALNTLASRAVQRVQPVLPLISVLAIGIIVGGITASNAGKIATSGALALFAVVLHNAAGIGAGWALARTFKLNEAKTTALAVEVGMQNSGLAVSLAAGNFAANPLATLPGALFSVWHNIAGAIFANWRRRRAEKMEKAAAA